MLSTPKTRVSPDEMRNRNAACRRALKTCTVRNERSRDPVIRQRLCIVVAGLPFAEAPPPAVSRPFPLLVGGLRLFPLLERVQDLVAREDFRVLDDRDGIRLVEP